MEVKVAYPEKLDKRSIYKMVKSAEVQKMIDAAGSELAVVAYVIYDDVDAKTGEVKEVVTIMTADGELFGTISQTFIREFKDIIDAFDGDVGNIKVITGTSKNNREYVTCSIA